MNKTDVSFAINAIGMTGHVLNFDGKTITIIDRFGKVNCKFLIGDLYGLYEEMDARRKDCDELIKGVDGVARLTERFSNGQVAVAGCGSNCKYDFKYCKDNFAGNCPTLEEIYEKLAFYEDLEAKGELLVVYGANYYPCTNCGVGWASISTKGCKSCHDDCEKLREYYRKRV